MPFRFRQRSATSHFAVRVLACLLALQSVSVGYSDAETDTGEIEIQVGLGGQYKLGHWAPIKISHTSTQTPATDIFVRALDGDGAPCDYRFDGNFSAGGDVIRFPIRIGRVDRPLKVFSMATEDGPAEVVATVPLAEAVESTRQLFLVLGSDVGVGRAIKLRRGSYSEPIPPTVITDAGELPDDWHGYDAFNLAILPTGDTKFLEAMSAVQIEALRQWVSLGGRLIVSVGANAGSLMGQGGSLAEFAPGEFAAMYRQTETTELEDYSKSRSRLDLLWIERPREEQGIDVARFDIARGLLAVSDGVADDRIPWVVRYGYGMGSICLVATDLDNGFVAEWKGRDRLLASIIDEVMAESSAATDRMDDSNRSAAVTHLGFNDLSGQLRAAMDQYADVRLVPFSLIAGVALLFIIIIGPVDYFVLRRLAPRMEWTWVTFPLAVLGLSGLALGLANAWKGAAPKLNSVDLLDLDLATGAVRCTSWAHMYPVDARKLMINAVSDEQVLDGVISSGDFSRLVSWHGLPGGGLGGMQDRASAAAFGEPYTINISRVEDSSFSTRTESNIRGLPIPTWSSRSLNCVWWATPKPDSKRVTSASLSTRRSSELEGTVRNPLPVTIRDAAVAYGRLYYQIGTLLPGQQFDLVDSQGRDFRYRLTRRRILDEDGREIVSPWDKASLDVPRIMEMVMFHDRAGGKSYTDLDHRFQGALDLSDHLMTGSAILVGRLDAPATQWNAGDLEFADKDSQHWSYCRILIPVNGASGQ